MYIVTSLIDIIHISSNQLLIVTNMIDKIVLPAELKH